MDLKRNEGLTGYPLLGGCKHRRTHVLLGKAGRPRIFKSNCQVSSWSVSGRHGTSFDGRDGALTAEKQNEKKVEDFKEVREKKILVQKQTVITGTKEYKTLFSLKYK